MYYFAYGLTMDELMIYRGGVYFIKRESGKLFGASLSFNKIIDAKCPYGCANLTKDINGCVEGVLYTIPNDYIHVLDYYMGFPREYIKSNVIVENYEQHMVSAVTHIAVPEMTREGLTPSESYLEHLLAGQRYLSDKYYQYLLSFKQNYLSNIGNKMKIS